MSKEDWSKITDEKKLKKIRRKNLKAQYIERLYDHLVLTHPDSNVLYKKTKYKKDEYNVMFDIDGHKIAVRINVSLKPYSVYYLDGYHFLQLKYVQSRNECHETWYCVFSEDRCFQYNLTNLSTLPPTWVKTSYKSEMWIAHKMPIKDAITYLI